MVGAIDQMKAVLYCIKFSIVLIQRAAGQECSLQEHVLLCFSVPTNEDVSVTRSDHCSSVAYLF